MRIHRRFAYWKSVFFDSLFLGLGSGQKQTKMYFGKVKHCILPLLIAFSLGNLSAQHNRNLSTQQHSKLHQDLIAGQQNIHKAINLVDSIALLEMLEEEEEKFPGVDIYGDNWDQTWVNPYKVPIEKLAETETIDVSEYCMPIISHITSNYGWRRRRMHRGVDLALHIGDTVRAAFSGKVRLTRYERRGYGYYVIIRHNNGLETIYGHLSKFLVKPDQIVKVGDPIALGGNTGRSTGPHLHFETRYLGMDINPNKIFDFVNQVTHTDAYTFNPKELASSLGYGRYKSKGTNNGAKYVSYRVRKGDSLSRIAHKYGVTISQLCRLNGIKRNGILREGRVLRIR